MGKKRCPVCKGKEFTPAAAEMTTVNSIENQERLESTAYTKTYDLEDQLEDYSDLTRSAVQAMESSYIVATSRTLDTVISRYEFLSSIHRGLVQDSRLDGYSLHIQRAIDQFKAIRYNTIPESYQMQLVIEPSLFDLREFYTLALEGVMRRSTAAQLAEIGRLKKAAAKQRRMGKIMQDLQTSLRELDKHCQGARSYESVRKQLVAAIKATEAGHVQQLLT